MSGKRMTCAYCGVSRPMVLFPLFTEAKCWECVYAAQGKELARYVNWHARAFGVAVALAVLLAGVLVAWGLTV